MKTDDLHLISNLGQSLWREPEQSRTIMRETVSAVTVLDHHPERAVEKTLQALLDRANKKGMYARVPNGFHALFPEERLILLALHRGRWSYQRIARVVRETPEMVEQLAWNARVYLALQRYPSAPVATTPDCPEYNPQRPWTQRFLDEEAPGQEKVFIQSHLARCASCRDALVRAKDLYYQVQAQVDTVDANVAQPGLTAQLRALVEQGRKIRHPATGSAFDGLMKIFERTDVRLVLLAWVVVFFYLKHKH